MGSFFRIFFTQETMESFLGCSSSCFSRCFFSEETKDCTDQEQLPLNIISNNVQNRIHFYHYYDVILKYSNVGFESVQAILLVILLIIILLQLAFYRGVFQLLLQWLLRRLQQYFDYLCLKMKKILKFNFKKLLIYNL